MTKAAFIANLTNSSWGTVSSVNLTSGVNAFTFSGGPITNTGTLQFLKNSGSLSNYLRGDGNWANIPGIKLAVSTTVATPLTSSYAWYKLVYNTINHDPDNAYSTANNRYTVPAGAAGVYLIQVSTNCRLAVSGDYYDVSVYKNGTILSGIFQGNSSESTYAQATANVLYTNTFAAGDYIEIWAKAESATSGRSANYIPAATSWVIHKLS